uniref:Uncharacterized protein n=1 Tax=Magallana gigas TaxID=29159 RepID=A0A8W8NT34_MAGGI
MASIGEIPKCHMVLTDKCRINFHRSSGSGILRTSGEAAKQYSNLKQRAKEKLSESKRPKTGGGPKPPSPTPVELSILEQLEGRPSLEGIC